MRTFWDELLVGAILTSRNIHKQDVLKTAPSCTYKRFYCVATWSNDKVKYPQNLQTVMETLPEAQRTQKLTLRLGLNLATTWRHVHYLQIWPPDGAT